ncbi:LysE family translocator [Streptomyces sp. NPDC005438]|uniref:LysE family translocator n=1 Tax=Streptomyces sp. NPDC005438 TaxID=3156880 RepID=UPI0033B26834
MHTWAHLSVFVPAALAVAASPGANNLLAFRNGLRSGLRSAALALCGRFLAFALMLGLVVAGLGAVLRTSQQAFEALRVLGAAYLIGLGLWIVWRARAPRGDSRATTGTAVGRPSSPGKLAVQEFLTAAANPKALLLFTAFLPPFVDTGSQAAPAPVQLAVLGAVYIACEALTALVWAGSGRLLAARGPRPGTLRRLDQASGGALVAFGGGLAVSDLSRR